MNTKYITSITTVQCKYQILLELFLVIKIIFPPPFTVPITRRPRSPNINRKRMLVCALRYYNKCVCVCVRASMCIYAKFKTTMLYEYWILVTIKFSFWISHFTKNERSNVLWMFLWIGMCMYSYSVLLLLEYYAVYDECEYKCFTCSKKTQTNAWLQ